MPGYCCTDPSSRGTAPYGRGRALSRSLLVPALALLAVAAAPAAGTGAAALEAELALAKTAELYLLLDPGRQVLEVKVRGVAVDTVPLAATAILTWGPVTGAVEGEPDLDLPAVLKVTWAPLDPRRQIIVPGPDLKTVDPDEEEEQEDDDGEEPGPEVLKVQRDAAAEGSYRVGLDNGWVLQVGDEIPSSSLWDRLGESLRTRWASLLGEDPEGLPVLALALSPEDGARIRHLFRHGRAILLVN